MTLQINLPDGLGAWALELATREQISVDALIASALTAQLDQMPHRPTVAERAARVDWKKVDAILARVPSVPPLQSDEL